MSETKHTKGPWVWERIEEAGSVRVSTLKGPTVLCRYWISERPDADARLIAAAPDLLVDLESCVAFLLQPSEARPVARHAAIQKALADIAKAKGQS